MSAAESAEKKPHSTSKGKVLKKWNTISGLPIKNVSIILVMTWGRKMFFLTVFFASALYMFWGKVAEEIIIILKKELRIVPLVLCHITVKATIL